jgi:hypothetical protein
MSVNFPKIETSQARLVDKYNKIRHRFIKPLLPDAPIKNLVLISFVTNSKKRISFNHLYVVINIAEIIFQKVGIRNSPRIVMTGLKPPKFEVLHQGAKKGRSSMKHRRLSIAKAQLSEER